MESKKVVTLVATALASSVAFLVGLKKLTDGKYNDMDDDKPKSNETKEDESSVVADESRLDRIKSLLSKSSVSSGMVIIPEGEENDEIIDIYDQEVIFEDDPDDSYLSVTLKVPDKIVKNKGDVYLEKLNASLKGNLKGGYSVKQYGFYGEHKSTFLERMKFEYIKNLNSIEGFRLISIRVYNNDYKSLLNCLIEMEYKNYILSYGDISIYEKNNVVRVFLE